MNNEPIKVYLLYCEPCGYTKKTESLDKEGLVEVKTTKIQKRVDKLKDNKKITGTFQTMPRKFKCPKCGRLITAKLKETRYVKQNWPFGSEGGTERS